MRKNKFYSKNLSLYTTYEIKGLNLDNLLNTAKKRGIALFNIKKYNNKRLIVTVSFNQSQNFFAIAKELCYNIKKVREGGKAKVLLSLYRSLGVLVGAIIFIAAAVYFDGLLFGITYTGSGSIYKSEVEEYLTSLKIVRFCRFSSFDLERLEDGVLSSNPHLSFVSCKKVGSRLVIDLELKKEDVKTLDGNVYQMISDVNGIIDSIKVYRGTAQVAVGQAVKKGDLLVDGVALIKEQTVKINVLASVTIVCQKEFNYLFDDDVSAEKALMFAEQELIDKQITDAKVDLTEVDGRYNYKVLLSYNHVLCVG